VPVRTRIDQATFLRRSRALLDNFEESSLREPYSILRDEEQQAAVLELEDMAEGVQAPLQKMEHRLHGWVAFLILPVFALANAGVAFDASALTGASFPVALGIAAGLLIGKPAGLFGAIWLAVRSGLVSLPVGVNWRHIAGLAFLGGIGFTMSLFIATLAFGDSDLLETAKVGILAVSIVSGTGGYLLLRTLRAPSSLEDTSRSAVAD
jgi:NhaA family Na+:H+ antiporter